MPLDSVQLGVPSTAAKRHHQSRGTNAAIQGQARPSDTFKQFFKLRSSVQKWVTPKLITLILDELNERYQETPWVWAMENEPLEKNNTCYFLLDGHILFTEQVEHHAGELMSMTWRVTQLIGNCIQADVAAVVIKLHNLLQNLELRRLGKRLMNLRILESVDSLHDNVQDQGIDARRIDIVSSLLEQTRQQARTRTTRKVPS